MTAPGRAQDPGPAVAGAESTAGHLPVTRRRRYGGRFRSELRLVLTDRGLAGAYGSRSFNKLPVNLKLPAHKTKWNGLRVLLPALPRKLPQRTCRIALLARVDPAQPSPLPSPSPLLGRLP